MQPAQRDQGTHGLAGDPCALNGPADPAKQDDRARQLSPEQAGGVTVPVIVGDSVQPCERVREEVHEVPERQPGRPGGAPSRRR